MNKLFSKIAGLSIGLAMAIGVGVAAGSKEVSPVHASPETGFTSATMTAGTNGSSCTVNTYSGIKVGTSSKGGDMSITVPSGATKLVLYAAAWKGVTGLSLNIAKTSGAASATISPSSISLTADTGISNSSPFTLSGTESNYRFELTLANITSDTKYTFTSSAAKRFVVWSAQTKAAETKVTATYVSTYGTLSKSSEQVNSGSSITMPTISNKPSTHEFEGFSDGSNTFAEGASTTISANTTYTAQWVEIKELISITLSGTYPTTFDQGATFSHEGMVVTAHYGDSTSADVTSNATWSGYNMSTTGNQTVTVSYTLASITKTATYGITVNSLPQYELITSAAGLETGAKYIIGNAAGTKFLSTTQNNNNRSAHTLAGTIVDDVVTYETGMEVIKLGGSSGAWTLEATAGTGGALGYLYAASSSSNYLRTQESSSTWTITFSGTTPTLTSQYNSYTHNILKNNGDLFSCYASGQTDVSLYKLVDTSESIAISKSSVSGLKTDSDTSVSITAKNFTPTNISVTYSTANVASITKGTISNKIIPLNIEFTGVGSTTATISVLGGKATYTCTLDITVSAKPNLLRVVQNRAANPLVDITSIELQNGGSARQFAKTNIYVEDTDENPIEIGTISDYVTLSRISGDDCISISGGEITGTSVGTAVVKFELKSLTSVYDTVTVSVIDDCKDSVNSITFNSSLTATQGDSVNTTKVFATRVANTRFGSTETIADSEFLYSYSNNRSGAEAYNVFSYDFSGTTVDPTHKSQIIYVFVTFDEEYSDSFTITVEQFNDPLTAITLTNVTDNKLSVSRGDSFQLEWAYNPENPTDGKEVVFRVDDNTDNIDITVSSSGLISIGSLSNLGEAKVVIESAHNSSISDFVIVSATLESMKYTVSEEESWNLVSDATTLKAGDVVVITGVKNDETLAMGTYSSGNNVKAVVSSPLTVSDGQITAGITEAMIYTLVSGTSSGTLAFKDSTGNYLNVCSSSSNYMHSESSVTANSSFTIDDSGNVYASGSTYSRNYMRFNPNGSNDAIFACYASTSSTGSLVTFYKKSGGDTEITVDATLFNAVHSNFGGQAATYKWDSSCASFDSGSWEDACDALKGITGYSTYKLNRAVGNIAGNEIEQFIAKYDIIIGKTSTDYDFLGRFSSGGINYNTRIDVNPIQLSAKNTSAVIIIVVISSISIAAVGGYFLFRRRKEQ